MPPSHACQSVSLTEAALESAFNHALDQLPCDLFKPFPAAGARETPSPTVRVGTAADGATIKKGSYLILDSVLVQIVDGAPQPVKAREGRGGEGVPARHARIIRGLILIRDAVREVLRAQAHNEP
jgi:N12 class adenine-specific DNA methylase